MFSGLGQVSYRVMENLEPEFQFCRSFVKVFILTFGCFQNRLYLKLSSPVLVNIV